MAWQIATIVSRDFGENCYLVWRDGQSDAVVIDPGFDTDEILEQISRFGLKVVAVLNTHGHADHIAGNAAIKQAFPEAPLIIGAGDAPMLADAQLNLSAYFGFPITSPPADRVVREGDVLEFGGMSLEVYDTPGHSPGHVVFVARVDPVYVFGGDVLFRGGVGRTDFPGGSTKQLLASIRDKLLTLPPDSVVYPGHGPATTTGREQKSNPYLQSL